MFDIDGYNSDKSALNVLWSDFDPSRGTTISQSTFNTHTPPHLRLLLLQNSPFHLYQELKVETLLFEEKIVLRIEAADWAEALICHPYPSNTTTLLSHYKSKYRSELIALGKQSIDSGSPRNKTILGTDLFESLTYLPPNTTYYFKSDKSLSDRKPDYKVTKPAHVNFRFGRFKKLFTQFLIGSNLPFNACESNLAKRMLYRPKFGLSKVVSRRQMTLQQRICSPKKYPA